MGGRVFTVSSPTPLTRITLTSTSRKLPFVPPPTLTHCPPFRAFLLQTKKNKKKLAADPISLPHRGAIGGGPRSPAGSSPVCAAAPPSSARAPTLLFNEPPPPLLSSPSRRNRRPPPAASSPVYAAAPLPSPRAPASSSSSRCSRRPPPLPRGRSTCQLLPFAATKGHLAAASLAHRRHAPLPSTAPGNTATRSPRVCASAAALARLALALHPASRSPTAEPLPTRRSPPSEGRRRHRGPIFPRRHRPSSTRVSGPAHRPEVSRSQLRSSPLTASTST
ncbi:hypothetical protein BRADI_2g06834v3 [Brachypodium distachyon]|uniref:Uncharacterized protein n=1 Tax=Brachypodium distachyon TaxID=15368 RepID=A0A0Q3IBP2_BRADI|nr:hypothetical protein BRADI_2g06834v3 [Brachypodium distachyon]